MTLLLSIHNNVFLMLKTSVMNLYKTIGLPSLSGNLLMTTLIISMRYYMPNPSPVIKHKIANPILPTFM